MENGKIKHNIHLTYFEIDKTNVNKIYIPSHAQIHIANDITFRPINNIHEFLAQTDPAPENIEAISAKYFIPILNQQELQKILAFELDIKIEKDEYFQEIYDTYKPTDLIELKALGEKVLITEEGTILLTPEGSINIGNVELNAVSAIDNSKSKIIWIEPVTGPIEYYINEFAVENTEDFMYHGQFPYYMELPEQEYMDFLKCVKNGNYTLLMSEDMFYSGELWLFMRPGLEIE